MLLYDTNPASYIIDEKIQFTNLNFNIDAINRTLILVNNDIHLYMNVNKRLPTMCNLSSHINLSKLYSILSRNGCTTKLASYTLEINHKMSSSANGNEEYALFREVAISTQLGIHNVFHCCPVDKS